MKNQDQQSILGVKRRPPSLNELTLIISNMESTHLGSKASKSQR